VGPHCRINRRPGSGGAGCLAEFRRVPSASSPDKLRGYNGTVRNRNSRGSGRGSQGPDRIASAGTAAGAPKLQRAFLPARPLHLAKRGTRSRAPIVGLGALPSPVIFMAVYFLYILNVDVHLRQRGYLDGIRSCCVGSVPAIVGLRYPFRLLCRCLPCCFGRAPSVLAILMTQAIFAGDVNRLWRSGSGFGGHSAPISLA
jgi:hypothetical protein